eukprot:GHVR01130089.1.p1 GENE.GHVR01130089.1~~GHVR01130089.1.p1  ORF type:complete len:417 (+),score=92.34 GHVR01130089.1:25-1251(+)
MMQRLTRVISRTAPFSARSFARKACGADPVAKTLRAGGKENKINVDNFWTEVADEKAIATAELYRNNVENYAGTVKVPVGICGPIIVKGNKATGKEYLMPFALTEGAVTASYTRGCKALNEGGGVTSRVIRKSMVRAPVFIFERSSGAADFIKWFYDSGIQKTLIDKMNEQPHCTVVKLNPILTDRKVHLYIGIDSTDAAGQNMVTYCGAIAMEVISSNWKGAKVVDAFVEGGFNSGKRGSSIHFLEGKGHYTVSDCLIPREVVKKVLHTTPEALRDFQSMHQRTNAYTACISSTAHVANGLTAMFIALGQDPACSAESQAAVTYFDVLPEYPDHLYTSITMPSLIVATVGGGTHLPSQRACLDVVGAKDAEELAEVMGAVSLGGEVSFYAAMAANEFAKAHWNMTHK